MKVQINLNKPPVSIAIPLQFNGPQPNHFAAQVATAASMKSGEFIGDIQHSAVV